MGLAIQVYSQPAIKWLSPGLQRRLAGIGLGLGLIIGSAIVGWYTVIVANWLQPIVGIIVQVIILASCLAGRSLAMAAQDVMAPLQSEDLALARSRLSRYVGRDTAHLSQSEILRALLETVAENTVDGVTAPLFYAIIGSFTPLGAVPLALAYKAASTLDSMVGYRREPYTDLGWFSAQLEDRLTWLPCRLTVISLCLISGRPQEVWHICRRDGVKDASPNSGWSEAAYAAILRVQLGGQNIYRGIVSEKPLLGEPIEAISREKITLALTLTRYCCLAWLALAIALHLLVQILST